MRRVIIAAVVCVIGICTGARADDGGTRMVIRNDGDRPVRVQVALGPVLPCDSKDNTLLLDAHVGPHETRTLGLGTVSQVCARATTAGSDIDWNSSRWLTGGYRCRRGRGCVRDTSIVMQLDVGR